MPAGSSFKCCASTLQTISGPIYHVFLGPKSVFQFLSARNVPVINNITWLPAVLVKCSNVVSVACRIQFVTYSIRNVGNGIFRQKFLDPDRELDQHQNRMFFYRATICVSASLLWPGVRLSVRQSVTFVHSIHTAEDVVKLLCRPGRPIILVFESPAPILNSKGIFRALFSGGAKYNGVGNVCVFPLKSPSISETVRDRPMVAMEH